MQAEPWILGQEATCDVGLEEQLFHRLLAVPPRRRIGRGHESFYTEVSALMATVALALVVQRLRAFLYNVASRACSSLQARSICAGVRDMALPNDMGNRRQKPKS